MTEFIQTYWIGVLFGALTALVGVVYKKLSTRVMCEIQEKELLKLGVQALLRDRIVQAYNHYIDKGYCPIYARENVQALYLQYHNLGGNGTITDIFNKLKELPYDAPN